MNDQFERNQVIQAIRNATNIQPKKINKMKEACVHYFHNIPNSKEGWEFIKQVRKFINKDRYKVRVLGRGSRKEHGTQSFVPLKHSERYSIYIDHKIMDRNHPDFLSRKLQNARAKIYTLKEALNQITGEF